LQAVPAGEDTVPGHALAGGVAHGTRPAARLIAGVIRHRGIVERLGVAACRGVGCKVLTLGDIQQQAGVERVRDVHPARAPVEGIGRPDAVFLAHRVVIDRGRHQRGLDFCHGPRGRLRLHHQCTRTGHVGARHGGAAVELDLRRSLAQRGDRGQDVHAGRRHVRLDQVGHLVVRPAR